jgi:hypothetical protein
MRKLHLTKPMVEEILSLKEEMSIVLDMDLRCIKPSEVFEDWLAMYNKIKELNNKLIESRQREESD